MLHCCGICWTVLLQHVFGEVDAAARAVELVACEQIGRARSRAEAAMDAGAQDAVRFRDLRVGELGGGEVSLHGVQTPAYMRPGFSTCFGSNCDFTRLESAASASGCDWNTFTVLRTSA